MKKYEKIAIILQEESTPSSKHNKLLKIRYSVEDLELLHLLDEVITGYKYYIKPRVSRVLSEESKALGLPCNNRQWHEYIQPKVALLRDYVELRISERKPEWEVIAFRNGWRPTF